MSFVGLVGSSIYWNFTVSVVEDKYSSLMQKINDIKDKAADIGESIAKLDEKESTFSTQVSMLTNMIANEGDEQKRAVLTSRLYAIQSILQRIPIGRIQLKQEEVSYQKEERKIQAEITTIEAERNLAQNAVKKMDQMRQQSLQRLFGSA